MNSLDLVQGSKEWKDARCGSLGASRVHEAIAKTKSGWGASRANLMADLVVERLTGSAGESYVNAAMQHGIDTEPQARAAYSFLRDADVFQIGLARHPSIEWTHASPDGLVGEDGLLEIKCPQSSTHIHTLLNDFVPEKYITQVQWQIACTDRQWCDFVSFDPRMPADMQFYCKRIVRDQKMIDMLGKEIVLFLKEVDTTIASLKGKYEQVAA